MTRKQALTLLGLQEGADLEEIKRAYRKLAFALHPDLHPDNLNASKEFQRVNEAYVFLSSPESANARSAPRGKSRNEARAEATERARAEARKAYDKAKARFTESEAQGAAKEPPKQDDSKKTREMKRDEVLQDLLRDPFARRVFEDIYSQIRDEAAKKQSSARGASSAKRPTRAYKPPPEPSLLEKTADNVSDWLRRQIDEEQTVKFSGALTPGKRIRLQIHHGVFGKSQTIELTLPPEFEPGRPIRLKGLGKRIGKWRGDLYLRIISQ
ncbi:MAG: Chaperone protein DnaJ [Desulfovibrio sp.]